MKRIIQLTVLSLCIGCIAPLSAEEATFSPETLQRAKLGTKGLILSAITLVSAWKAYSGFANMWHHLRQSHEPDKLGVLQWAIFNGTALYGTYKIGRMAYQAFEEVLKESEPIVAKNTPPQTKTRSSLLSKKRT